MVVDYHYATMSRHWCKRSRTRRMAVLCRRSLCFAFFHVPTKMLLNVCSWYIEFVSNLALWCGQQHSRFLPTRRFLSVSCVSSELLDGSPLVPRLYTRFGILLLTGFSDVLGDGVALLCSIRINVHQYLFFFRARHSNLLRLCFITLVLVSAICTISHGL